MTRARELGARVLTALSLPLSLPLASCGGAESADVAIVSVPSSSAAAPALTAAVVATSLPRPPKDPAELAYKNKDGQLCMPAELTQRDAAQEAGRECGVQPGEWVWQSKWACGGCSYGLDRDATARERDRHADACCFTQRYMPKHLGRPLLADEGPIVAPARPGPGWAEPGRGPVRAASEGARSPLVAALLARHLEAAGLEHASVAELARVALGLVAVGAPLELVTAAHRAARDEVRHARLFFSLASELAGAPLGPGALDVARAGAPPCDRLALFDRTLDDGCVGETIAALEARVAADEARARGALEPRACAALEALADDEARHAELAYAIAAWLVATSSSHERDAMARSLERALEPRVVVVDDGAGRAASDAPEPGHGHLDAASRAAVAHDAMRTIVRPALEALLMGARVGSSSRVGDAWRGVSDVGLAPTTTA